MLDDDRLRVQFDEPQLGVSPGQAVVLYDGERVLGAGGLCNMAFGHSGFSLSQWSNAT